MKKFPYKQGVAFVFATCGVLCLASSNKAIADDEPNSTFVRLTGKDKKPGYTINFNNVSIKEYLKFISKIADLNFIYDEQDLNFNVTIVSEEPTDLANVLAALVQVLRIHGLGLLDDGVNLVIHQSAGVNQIATVVSAEHPFLGQYPPPLITRVFKLKNANPSIVETVLKPMLSDAALLEVIPQSRHVIITDSPAGIDKIADLLMTLDAPQSPLDVDAYSAKNNSPENLVTLATQIITPLAEGNPVIMVPQSNTSTIFIVSTPHLIEKTLGILEDLDAAPVTGAKEKLLGDNIFLYNLRYRSGDALESVLKQISDSLESQGYAQSGLLESLANARYIKETNSILFTGDPQTLTKIKQLLDTIDAKIKPLADAENSTIFIYKPTNRSASSLAAALKDLASNLSTSNFSDRNLTNAIKNLQIEASTGSLVFTGDQQTITEVKLVLSNLDTLTAEELAEHDKKFYIYKIQKATEEQIAKSLSNLADNLEESGYPDKGLIEAIDTMKWVKETNALIFTGTSKALDQLAVIVPTFDVPSEYSKASLDALPPTSEFYLYSPKILSGTEMLNAIKSLTSNLQTSGLANPSLLRTLENAKWVPSSNAIVFTGDTPSLQRIQQLMPTIDIQEGTTDRNIVYIYNIKFVPVGQLQNALINISQNLPADDPMVDVIKKMKVASDSKSIVFKGPSTELDKIKDLLSVLDTKEKAVGSPTFFVYKLQHVPGDIIINDLNLVAKRIQSSRIGESETIKAIRNIEWIKSTNFLYVSGSPDALSEVKELIQEFDIIRQLDVPTEYYIFMPATMPPEEVQQQLASISEGLQSAGLSNPDLIQTINTAKYVPENNTIVFTGTPQSILQVKNILQVIESQENKSSIQRFGKKTFFIYKLKYVPGPQLISYLKSISSDIERIDPEDKDLAHVISTARFIPDTNSVIFTGSLETLEKIQELVAQFDIENLAPSTAARVAEDYFVYQSSNVQGQELINILKEFENNLVESGLQERQLFDTINNLKYMDKTSSIIVSGSKESVQKVLLLLEKFDVPAKGTGPSDTSIETLDDISFLIYKLKYHQGSEIEDALKKIAVDLLKAQTPNSKAQGLLGAIQSVQWIEVTNSLLGTGTPQSLSKLKNLIENIDVPLQQIFIEVLVIETDIENTLSFGLRWGGQGQWRKRLGYAGGAFPKFNDAGNGSTITDPLQAFNDNLGAINATDTPTGALIPFTQGFGLGVIGDLIYHKGQSYTALGSLLDALRQDGDSTIILSQKLITQDNKSSTLFVGDNIPFTGSTVQNAGNSSTVFTSNLEYKDIGVSLNITPRVGDNGLITLTIDEEISEDINQGNQASATTSGTTSAGNIASPNTFGISTSKRTLQTQATVPDQHFLVLSGMIRNQKDKQRVGIPCLGGLPIIGAAFTRQDSAIAKSNVIIFVRPQIITSFQDYKDITERQEDLFRSQADAEDFDKGLEVVKTPDDK